MSALSIIAGSVKGVSNALLQTGSAPAKRNPDYVRKANMTQKAGFGHGVTTQDWLITGGVLLALIILGIMIWGLIKRKKANG